MAVYTYNPKQIKMAFGSHLVSGYAEDKFIQIEMNGDGTKTKVGCDGEINRAIGVDKTYKITLTLLQNSPTNKWLRSRFEEDQDEGTGMFPITIKDIMGEEKFSSELAWVVKQANWGRGKETTDNEWELHTAEANFGES